MSWPFSRLFGGAGVLLIVMVFGGMAIIKPRGEKSVISSDGVRWEDGTFVPHRDIARVRWPHAIKTREGHTRHVMGSADPKRTRVIVPDLVNGAGA